MIYEIQDSYGAPQCGFDSYIFHSMYEVEQFLEQNPGVEERLKDGYAILKYWAG